MVDRAWCVDAMHSSNMSEFESRKKPRGGTAGKHRTGISGQVSYQQKIPRFLQNQINLESHEDELSKKFRTVDDAAISDEDIDAMQVVERTRKATKKNEPASKKDLAELEKTKQKEGPKEAPKEAPKVAPKEGPKERPKEQEPPNEETADQTGIRYIPKAKRAKGSDEHEKHSAAIKSDATAKKGAPPQKKLLSFDDEDSS
eukprot:GHVO01046232.1.p1 GENE.GHVO01046232.1~~GHVO01046232.1.p1  ORF type:complete len:201 (-),score=34.97 GHVO01046232.1:41-643(-)